MSENTPAADPRRGRATVVVVAVLLLASLAAATFFTVTWFTAKRDADSPRGDVRVALLADAGTAAVALNNFDTNDIAATFDQMDRLIVGEALRVEMQDARASLESQPPTGGTMSAFVSDSAISALDVDAGTGSVVAVVIRKTAGTTDKSIEERVMMQLHMRLVDGVWKVDTVDSYGTAQTIRADLFDDPAVQAAPADPAAPDPAVPPADPAPADPAPAGAGN